MKYLIIAFFSLLVAPLNAETISSNSIVGEWDYYSPEYDIRYKLASFISGSNKHKMHLTIKSSNDVTFFREFESGEKEIIKASKVEKVDDLLIIYLPRDDHNLYKLTLGGWDLKHSKRIFGYFYLYNQDGLFNGWPVSFAPKQ